MVLYRSHTLNSMTGFVRTRVIAEVPNVFTDAPQDELQLVRDDFEFIQGSADTTLVLMRIGDPFKVGHRYQFLTCKSNEVDEHVTKVRIEYPIMVVTTFEYAKANGDLYGRIIEELRDRQEVIVNEGMRVNLVGSYTEQRLLIDIGAIYKRHYLCAPSTSRQLVSRPIPIPAPRATLPPIPYATIVSKLITFVDKIID